MHQIKIYPAGSVRENVERTYSFNVYLVNEKLPSFSAANPIGHDDMSNSQEERGDEQGYLHGLDISPSVYPPGVAKHEGSLEWDKHQRRDWTYCSDRQIRPSGEPWPIAQAVNTYTNRKQQRVKNGALLLLMDPFDNIFLSLWQMAVSVIKRKCQLENSAPSHLKRHWLRPSSWAI